MPKVYEDIVNRIFDDMIGQIAPSSTCPGLTPSGKSGITRIDTLKRSATSDIFLSDRMTFKKLGISFFVREQWRDEFDQSPALHRQWQVVDLPPELKGVLTPEFIREAWSRVPRLWVSVTQVQPNVHQVTTLFRGNPDWPTKAISDENNVVMLTGDALTEALEKIQECGGLDDAALRACYRPFYNQVLAYAAVNESEGTVN